MKNRKKTTENKAKTSTTKHQSIECEYACLGVARVLYEKRECTLEVNAVAILSTFAWATPMRVPIWSSFPDSASAYHHANSSEHRITVSTREKRETWHR
jgi:hypothetical protein